MILLLIIRSDNFFVNKYYHLKFKCVFSCQTLRLKALDIFSKKAFAYDIIGYFYDKINRCTTNEKEHSNQMFSSGQKPKHDFKPRVMLYKSVC